MKPDMLRKILQERNRQNFEFMKKIREDGWRKRRIAMGLDPNKEGDPAFDELDTDSELEDLLIPEEPPELRAARESLAAYSARQVRSEGGHAFHFHRAQFTMSSRAEHLF